ncbi:dicarboxylate/amino acid:cation symporter [Peptostreptococcus canis]|uniref:Dicarboxylate/amino acid:cation symporter n=1 Tax=Peptostreptococcus canis TaxID=1159213 RepID=A0ABR6TKD3_9FIRM|nr:dicarboxylate/amino acid:cation symporter [Peptostreptococcus canis]MBC2575867.1 dicarboxylate/amino acid:cation symporter [Peptostreptococcus canis]MBP1998013.1 Na+/H+-dicarboxylate symporter [Peptostreptococcus canis]
MKKIKLGLVSKLVIAIIIGIILGNMKFLPANLLRVLITLSSLFGEFLNFIIPLMIIGFVVKGIAELSEGAGKLLGITALTAYCSTLIAGTIAYFVAKNLFPTFITAELIEKVKGNVEPLTPFFKINLTPMLDVTSAVVFAFIMGLSISWLKGNGRGKVLFEVFDDFEAIISKVLSKVIIPLLPLFIAGNFTNMSYTGSVFSVLSIFWKVFVIVIILHLLYVSLMFTVSGTYAGKNPFRLIRNQVNGYMTAIGTQSSAATIPVNLKCAEKNGVSEDIRNFVVPLCATIHLAGSMITITSCSVAVLLMNGINFNFGTVFGFIAMLGVAMVAAPGAPGGAIMSALPFLPMVGITTEVMQQLMITLYLTQDSFGTAANVSGDNAIAVFIDKLYTRKIKKA